MFSFRSHKRRGFTLIELLTVIAIIGILAAMVIGVTRLVNTKAKVAASKAMYQEWASALEQYKSSYGFYPYIGAKAGDDRYIDLSNRAATIEFVKCLTGRQPMFDSKRGQPLDPAEAKKYNKRGQEFCSISGDALHKDDTGNYSGLLTDRFGNTRIRIYMDANGDGIINAPAELTPADNYGVVQGALAAKIIIYTLKKDGPDFADVLSWQ